MIDGGLRKIFRQKLPHFHWLTVETGETEQGIPDSNFCINGNEGWIEYKKTHTNKVGLRAEQVGWLLRRSRAGGKTWIVVRYRHDGGIRKGEPADYLYIFNGNDARVVAVEGLRAKPLARFVGGPSKWDWASIEAILSDNPKQ